tara:strand:- start:47 stop:424 length:378 start_codon:yes stop_codon:yes gene_type:complete
MLNNNDLIIENQRLIEENQALLKKIDLLEQKINLKDEVDIILYKYKKSLIVSNKYLDKNTTIKCKDILKELGGKWFKNEKYIGWIFVGIFKDNIDDNIIDVSKFILDKLQENYKVRYEATELNTK